VIECGAFKHNFVVKSQNDVWCSCL